MFQTTLKNLAARKLRLLTTSFAVLLGVAFMAGTLVLTDTIGKTFDGLFAEANDGTDAYVRGELAFDSELMGEQRARLDVSPGRRHQRRRRRRRGRGPHRGLRPARRQGRQADRQPRHGCARRSAATGWPTTTSTRSTSPRAAPRRPTTRSSSTSGSAETGDFAVGDPTTVLTEAGPQAVDHRRHRDVRRRRQPGRRSVHDVHPDRGAGLPHGAGQGRRDQGASPTTASASASSPIASPQVVPDGHEVLTGAEITAEEQAAIKEDMSFFNVVPDGRSPSSPCSSARSSSTTRSRSSLPSAPRRWR